MNISEIMMGIMRGPQGTIQGISNAFWDLGVTSPDHRNAAAEMLHQWVALVAVLEGIIDVRCEV